MPGFIIYGLQIIICSGIMMLYYLLLLRNRRFHQYNRFYIISVFILPWIVPLVKINLFRVPDKPIPQILYIVADGNNYIDRIAVASSFRVDWWLVTVIAYFLICLVFTIVFIKAIVTLYKLQKQNPKTFIHNFWLVSTNVAGTPFSFFKYIFWNDSIDVHSATGTQMLRHEIVHVNEKHSIDTVLMQIVLCIGWFNPFFWFAKKELTVIHEFIADNKSVAKGNTAAFVTMLLTAAYPDLQYTLTHSFFFSPIKRRLLMLTQNKHPKFSYFRRISILPLMAIIIFLFAFRAGTAGKKHLGQAADATEIQKQFTSVPENLPGITRVSSANKETPNKLTAENTIKKNISNDRTIQKTTFSEEQKERVLASGTASKADSILKNALYVLNGKIISKEDFGKIDPRNIATVSILKNSEATSLYGDGAKNGVMFITTKERSSGHKTTTVTGSGYASLTGTDRDEKLPKDYRDFLARNEEITDCSWKTSPLRIVIELKDGTKEEYNLENESSRRKATERYGLLPLAPSF